MENNTIYKLNSGMQFWETWLAGVTIMTEEYKFLFTKSNFKNSFDIGIKCNFKKLKNWASSGLAKQIMVDKSAPIVSGQIFSSTVA